MFTRPGTVHVFPVPRLEGLMHRAQAAHSHARSKEVADRLGERGRDLQGLKRVIGMKQIDRYPLVDCQFAVEHGH